MIGIYTNVLLRIVNDDDPEQAKKIWALLAPLDEKPHSVRIDDIALAETVWVLQSVYALLRASGFTGSTNWVT